jgi:hypothetical protein
VFKTVAETGIAPSDMLGYKYLEALPAVADGDSNKLMLLPSGAANAMGAIAGLGAAFSEGAAPTPDTPAAPRRRPGSQSTPPPKPDPPAE